MGRMGQHLWSWEPAQFENLNTEKVTTEATQTSWDVMLEAPNIAWGYSIALCDEARAHIMWRCRLEVLHVLGDVMPGLAFFDGETGVAFQVDVSSKKAELRRVVRGKETLLVEDYPLQDIAQPFDLLFEYNALTKKCSGILNGEKIFERQLPYTILPAPDEVNSIEILTTTPPGGTGTIGYGELTLQCE